MSSVHQYPMDFFFIFLLICLGVPATEGMISTLVAFSDCKPQFDFISQQAQAFLRLGDQRRSELKDGGGAHR